MFSKIDFIKNSISEIDGKIVSKNFAQVDIVFTFEMKINIKPMRVLAQEGIF